VCPKTKSIHLSSALVSVLLTSSNYSLKLGYTTSSMRKVELSASQLVESLALFCLMARGNS
jgi:hypothetical protein